PGGEAAHLAADVRGRCVGGDTPFRRAVRGGRADHHRPAAARAPGRRLRPVVLRREVRDLRRGDGCADLRSGRDPEGVWSGGGAGATGGGARWHALISRWTGRAGGRSLTLAP